MSGSLGMESIREGFGELRERYHRLVELAPDGILIHDGERIVMANLAAVRLAGAERPQELVGHAVEEFLNPPFLKSIEEQLVSLQQQLHEQAVETEIGVLHSVGQPTRDSFLRVDGSKIDVEVTAIPFLSHGRPAAHLVIRDITHRLRQEASVMLAESKMRLLLEQMPATLWTTDMELHVTSTLDGRRDSLGERFDESVDSSPDGDVAADEIDTPLHLQRRALDGQSVAYDVNRDGKAFEVHVKPLHAADGAVSGIVGLALDVTERRLNEAHAREAQKMELVGALAGGVAHEVNNMMTVVLAFADFLSMEMAGQEERLTDIEQIRIAAHRAASVTGQLLAFSRRTPHQPESLDVDDAVDKLLSMVRKLLGEGRPLQTRLACGRRVFMDQGHLEQVVVNLVLNARHAMAAGGTLTIETTCGVMEGTERGHAGVPIPPGEYALLSVRDTGIGMDAHTAAHLFEPFFTTKPIGEGTGLGLAAVAGIMQQNGGYIDVDSAHGAGATFTLYLPLLPENAVAPEATRPTSRPRPSRSGHTILLVEDEPGVRLVAARGLERHGYRVVQSADATNALEMIARDGLPDLVLTDLVMPGMNGMEFAAHLKARWPGLPVLMMSGYAENDMRRELAQSADLVVIDKPFTIDGLVRSVEMAIVERSPGEAGVGRDEKQETGDGRRETGVSRE